MLQTVERGSFLVKCDLRDPGKMLNALWMGPSTWSLLDLRTPSGLYFNDVT